MSSKLKRGQAVEKQFLQENSNMMVHVYVTHHINVPKGALIVEVFVSYLMVIMGNIEHIIVIKSLWCMQVRMRQRSFELKKKTK